MASRPILPTLVLLLACLSLFVPPPSVTSQPSPSPSPSSTSQPPTTPPSGSATPPSVSQPPSGPATPPSVSQPPSSPSPPALSPPAPQSSASPPPPGTPTAPSPATSVDSCVSEIGAPLPTPACCQILQQLPVSETSGPLCSTIESRLKITIPIINQLIAKFKVIFLYSVCKVQYPSGFTCPALSPV